LEGTHFYAGPRFFYDRIVRWTKGFHFLPLGGSFKPCKRALHITELLVYYFCFYS
jgi:hypothetical protein